MRKLKFLLACLFVAFTGLANAQTRSVTGKVLSSENGEPVIGATVVVKGATSGTATDVDGVFKITLKGGEKILKISYIGMKTTEVEASDNMVVKMDVDSKYLNEVVVTGMGIKRDQKALGYAATAINSRDVTNTGNRSALNALEGKLPGVEITSASGAPGASTRVIMRGFSSLASGNQPLYVIDGVPINNDVVNDDDINGGYDFGNRANDINPEDIESMTVLQGGSGTALYGSRAAAGVIIITTKNGSKAGNKAKVDISSTTSFETPLRLPVMQNEFGQGWYDRGGGLADLMENGSWGPRFDGKTRVWGFEVDGQQQIKPYVALKNNVKDFFDIGVTENNTIAISNGDENKSFYLSYGNINADGIMPSNADSYIRNNISLRGTAKFLKIFTGSASLNYVRKDMKFVPTGQDQSVLDGIWQTARDISIVDLKDYNNKFNNVDNYYTAFAQNPYYVLNEHGNKFLDNRIYGNVGLEANLLPGLTASFKAGTDVSNSTRKAWRAITNCSRFDYNDEVGRVAESSYYTSEFNTDLMLNYSKNFGEDFSVKAVLGHNFNQRDNRNQSAEVIGLDVPKFYNLSNSFSTPSVSESKMQRRLVGVYGSFDFGYKSILFMNVTARNDWSSTLPAANRSYFYPGASLSFVFSELIGKNDILSFGKIRAGIARTGKDADPYLLYNTFVQNSLTDGYRYLNFPISNGSDKLNGFTVSNLIGNSKLKPEISTDNELGLELKFFENRFGLDATVYNKVTKDLIWNADVPYSTGFTTKTENLGEITNKGVEILLSIVPVRTNDFEWEITGNFSKNRNMLVKLADGLEQISLGGTSSVPFVGVPGRELGLFECTVPATDPDGHIIVDNQGLPVFKDKKEIVGSSQNKFRMGGGTALRYKNFRLSATVDYRNGGLMYSRTAEMMYFTGNAPQTTFNDRQPFIIPNSVKLVNGNYVENTTAIAGFSNNMNLYYNQTYNAGIGGKYVLMDKTFFKLREVTLSYTMPKSALNTKIINNVEFSLVGTNLLLWTPNSNLFCDPEQTTFGNDLAADFGDYGATPTTRSFGFSVKLGF